MNTPVSLEQIQGVTLYSGKKSIDLRGSFTKFFERNAYAALGLDPNFNSLAIASNIEMGTIRGFHFQSPPFDEEKLITCLQGRLFDVIVDLRRDSQTLGKWATIELSSEVPATLCLPRGVAHGYQTLSPGAIVFYGLTSEFNPDSAHSLDYADSDLNVPWPLPITKISPKDSTGTSLKEAIELAAGIPV